MKNRASSFRVEAISAPWYVVAARSDDGLVAEDYYKRGLLINQKLKGNTEHAVRDLRATLIVGPEGQIRARVEGANEPARHLRLLLAHPAHSERDQVVVLDSIGSNEYVGKLVGDTAGRWIVTLETDTWRLPTTTASGPLTVIRLGSPAAS